MKELEEGQVLINQIDSESYTEDVVADISLDITYHESHKSKMTNSISSQFVRIYTQNSGGGNYFRIQTGFGPDSESEEESTYAFEDFDKLQLMIDDFKKRYEAIKNVK